MDQEQPSDHVNDVAQVGGDHYGKGYGHWDWVIDNKIPYLESCATKYLARWESKDGIKDLKKSLSYVEKIKISYEAEKIKWVMQYPNIESFHRFCSENQVTGLEQTACWLLMTWRTVRELLVVIGIIEQLIETTQDATQAQAAPMGASGAGSGYSAALANANSPQIHIE